MKFKRSVLISILLVVVLCAVCLPYAAAAAPYRPSITAHRGASGYLPEHTLAANALAHALLIDGDFVEPDVLVSSDGIPFVLHDLTLQRTTNVAQVFSERGIGAGGNSFPFADYTMAELKQLSIIQHNRADTFQFPQEHNLLIDWGGVITLEEYIIFVQGMNKATGRNIGIYPETKAPGGNNAWPSPDNIKPVIDVLTKYGYNHPNSNAILQSFNLHHLVRARNDYGWVGPSAYLSVPNAAMLTNIGGWEGIARVANIWAPTFTALRAGTAAAPELPFRLHGDALAALAVGMTLGGYTHDRYGGVGRANFRTERELFDFVFKTAQAEAMFTDYPDRVVDYLIRNNMRDGRITGLPYIGPEYVYRPKVAAHRGASGYLPEHTLEGFAYAYGLGADLLEPDVQITRDGVPIVLHDPTLQRTTNVHDVFPGRHRSINDQGVHQYYAGDFTWAEIKQLTVTESIIRGGSNDGRPTYPDRFPIGPEYDYGVPFRILSLEELIRLTQGLNFAMQRDVGIYPETKHDIHNDNIEPVIDLLIEFGYNHPVGSDRPGGEALLQSFQPGHIIRARNDYGWVGPTVVLPTSFFLLDSGADILMTQEGVKEIAKYADFYAPTISNLFDFSDFGWIPHDRVQWARDAGMGIHTWTHRTDDWARTPTANVQVRFTEEQLLDALFKAIRLDGIFTDFPDVVIGYLYDNNMRGVSARPTRKHYVFTAGSVAGANGTVAVSTGAANVTMMSNAVDGASGYTVLYEDGLTLTLTATPNAGYRFDGWFENDVKIADAGAVYTFTATAENRMLEARFEARFIPDDDSNSGCNVITNAFGALVLLSVLWISAKRKKRS